MFVFIGNAFYNINHIISIQKLYINLNSDLHEIRMNLTNGTMIQVSTGTEAEMDAKIHEIMKTLKYG